MHGKEGFLQCVFSCGESQAVRRKTKMFSVHALPHLSLLLGLWPSRLRWCPQGCFTGVSYFCTGKGKALPSCQAPLYPIHPLYPTLSSQPCLVELRGDFPSFSALLATAGQEPSHPLTAGQQGMFPFSQHHSSPAVCRAPLLPAQKQH